MAVQHLGALDALIRAYRRHQQRTRGLREKTLDSYERAARWLLRAALGDTYSLLQVFLAKLGRGEVNDQTYERLIGELKYVDDTVVLYSKNRVDYLTPLHHQEALLSLSEGARRRVLAKTRKLKERLLLGTDMPRRLGI